MLHAWDIALLFTQRVERIELRQAAFYCEIAELPRQNLSVPHECADIQIVVGYIGLVAEIHRKAGVFEAQQLVFEVKARHSGFVIAEQSAQALVVAAAYLLRDKISAGL